MPAQSTDHRPAPDLPPMRTLRELRAALRTHGAPGDLDQLEEALDTADLDDLPRVRRITQHYHHRAVLRLDPVGWAAVGRSAEDVMTELRHKLAAAGGGAR
ncbi:hypothetical protein Q3V23_33915 [Streptomyces sp. VNUA116]|uniref:hypothetical protein n=1 Tax=Streptomyces sp. VNUA116 TaxID=3062449 RepID=UPI002675C4A3|nr:hypothetical protein [Streptomyces sp. VNUA116]WKU48674.1 hypothetical protein Q3V23_33915 [Streptomyces sp. VNUA116]